MIGSTMGFYRYEEGLWSIWESELTGGLRLKHDCHSLEQGRQFVDPDEGHCGTCDREIPDNIKAIWNALNL